MQKVTLLPGDFDLAAMLSAVMMPRYIGQAQYVERIEKALTEVLK